MKLECFDLDVFNYLNSHITKIESKCGRDNIDFIIRKFNLSQNKATEIYYLWKEEYMHCSCTPRENVSIDETLMAGAWTKDEEDFLLKNKNKDIIFLMEKLKRTEKAIRCKLLKIDKPVIKFSNAEKDNLYRLRSKGIAIEYIAVIIGRPAKECTRVYLDIIKDKLHKGLL